MSSLWERFPPVSLLALLLLCLMAATATATASAPPSWDPNQQPLLKGYGFPRGTPNAPVWLELHGDLLCIDTLEDWDNVISPLLAHYKEHQVYFIFHPFPLPYHYNAFFAAKAGNAVEALQPGKYLDWVEAVFDEQNSFLKPAANKTEPEVIQMFADLAQRRFSIPNDKFYQQFNLDATEMTTRAQWKFSAARGVSGTPTYFVNGVRVLSGNWSTQDWINAIDSLL